MKICETMKKVPGGLMVVPLLAGCAFNTFFPEGLEIGGFTTAVFKDGTSVLIGLFLVFSGATINLKQVGMPVLKGALLTGIKLGIGAAIGCVLNYFCGAAGLFGITPLAIIAAMTNSNGAVYTALAKEFGDATDIGAISILSLNDGPFFTMIVLGASGMASIPLKSLAAALIPLIIGIILGNLDKDFRNMFLQGMDVLLPFTGFALGANMSYRTIFEAGAQGIVLGLATVIATGFGTYFIYSLIWRKKSPLGMAVGTTGGNAVATPASLELSDPSLSPYTAAATAQVAAAVVVTAVLTPVITGILAKRHPK